MDISYFVLFAEIFMSISIQDKNWGVLEVKEIVDASAFIVFEHGQNQPQKHRVQIVHNLSVGSELEVG